MFYSYINSNSRNVYEALLSPNVEWENTNWRLWPKPISYSIFFKVIINIWYQTLRSAYMTE